MTPRRAGALIALGWLIYGLPQVAHHGLAIDSPSLFYAGDRTYFWLTHPGHPEALDFTYPAPEPAGFQSAFFPFPDKNDPFHYPVFAGLVAAFTAQIAAVFGVPPVPGHHLGLVLLHAIGLYGFTLLACRLLGLRSGLLAGVGLLLFPDAIGQAFNNAKDWPCVDFYACAMLAAAEAFLMRRAQSAVLAGVFGGIALSCKLNGAFAMASVGGLAAYALWKRSRAAKRLDLSAARELAITYAIASGLFFVLWPYLYHGPITGWPQHVIDYLQWYLAYGRSPRATWTDFPLRSLLFTTAPLLLACALVGTVVGLRAGAERRELTVFLGAWVALPILRTLIPHSNFYDGNRHFMEYIPALCAIGGLGAEWLGLELTARLAPKLPEVWVRRGCWAIYTLSLALPVLQYRPFEATYFNFLVGGLGGAQSRALYDMPAPHDLRVRGTEGDYWYGNLGDGLPHLQALLGVDAGASQGVYFCGPAPQQVVMSWPEGRRRLRQSLQPGDLAYVSPREVFCGIGLARLLESQRPILYRAERGGGLIYEILGPVDGQAHVPSTSPSLYEADRTNFGSLR